MRTRKILALALAALTILLAVPPIPAGATYSGGASLVYSTGTTNKVVADKYGNVYLLKTDGLVKYDGTSFTQISSRVFDAVTADSKGNIWGASEGNLYKIPVGGSEQQVSTPESLTTIYYFYCDSSDKLWIIRGEKVPVSSRYNYNIKVLRYDGSSWQTQSIIIYANYSNDFIFMPRLPYHCYVDRQYNVWIIPKTKKSAYNTLYKIAPDFSRTGQTIKTGYSNDNFIIGSPTRSSEVLVWPNDVWGSSDGVYIYQIQNGSATSTGIPTVGTSDGYWGGPSFWITTDKGLIGSMCYRDDDPDNWMFWETGAWRTYHMPNVPPHTRAPAPQFIAWDADNRPWFISPLNYDNSGTGTLYYSSNGKPISQASSVTSFAIDSEGSIWYVSGGKVYRITNSLIKSASHAATQSSITITCNYSGSSFDRYQIWEGSTLLYEGAANSFTHSGLAAGVYHTYKIRARLTYTGGWTRFITYTARTIPPTPSAPTGTVTPLSWSNTAGRAKIVLNWSAVTGATGYKVWVFDGNTYRAFDVGNTTSWDSSVARIYPPESQLDGYGDNTQSGDLFYHNQGGLDLRDDPNKLYRKTVGSTYDSAHNYWFRVSAYNESGESPQGNAYMPTCPNRTDTQAPQVVSVVINDGDAKTGLTSVKVTVTAKDPAVSNYTADTSDDASGVKQIRFSNDNTVWSAWQAFDSTATTPNESRTRSFTWDLSAGGGTKTVYVQVMDQAGNVSATMADTILFVDDVTAPSASFMINGGDASTASRYVSLAITATDDLTPMSNLQMRFSNDGLNFSPWEPFAPTKNWDLAWPGTSASDGQKTVYMQVKDAQGNTTTVASKIGLNQSMPTGSLSPASGIPGTVTIGGSSVSTRFVNNTRVVLNLQPTSADRVQYSLDGITWSPWERLTGTVSKQLTVSPGDGQKTIYVKWGNSYGGESPVQSVEFTLDMTPPRLEASWLGGATVTKNGQATLVLDAVDNISGRTGLTAKIVVGTTSPVTYNYSSVPRTVTLSFSGSGAQVVTVYVYDQAGNEASKTLTIFN